MKHLFIIGACLLMLSACTPKAKTVTGESTTKEQTATTSQGESPNTALASNGAPSGTIQLSELLANSKKYDGQLVKVQGKVIKVNNMIMNRNWIHIQDGSLQDEKTDLTITSTDNVVLGEVVAFEGKIALHKDFGAGYTYDIIMEEAHIIR